MDWATIATLIVQYGLPFAEKLVMKWTNNEPVTLDEWNALKALAQNNAQSQLIAALSRAGISSNDPRYVQLMSQLQALTNPPVAQSPMPASVTLGLAMPANR